MSAITVTSQHISTENALGIQKIKESKQSGAKIGLIIGRRDFEPVLWVSGNIEGAPKTPEESF